MNSATKRALLSHLLSDAALERVIVFTRTKRGANRVAEALEDRGVSSEAIHGNKSQNARQKALDNFSRGKARVLVATDLASRGIDVTGVTHVINYELPADAESYVHRIGRTARAGASGIALSFCDCERARPAQEHRAADQPAHRRRLDAGQRGHAGGAADASARRARGARRRASARSHRGRRSSGRPGGGQVVRRRSRPPMAVVRRHRPVGDRSRGDRPPAQAEHQWPRGDYRDQPQGDRPQGDSSPEGDPPLRRPSPGDRPEGRARYGARRMATRAARRRVRGG